MRNRQMVQQKLPGLTYPDDVVLLADNGRDLQTLLNLCDNAATNLGLKFCREIDNYDLNVQTSDYVVLIERQVVPIVNQYKNIGVYINAGKTYSSIHQVNRKIKRKRSTAIIKHRSLWAKINTRWYVEFGKE